MPGVIRRTVTRSVIDTIWIQGEMRRNAPGVMKLINTP